MLSTPRRVLVVDNVGNLEEEADEWVGSQTPVYPRINGPDAGEKRPP